jgi:hypothetical protein
MSSPSPDHSPHGSSRRIPDLSNRQIAGLSLVLLLIVGGLIAYHRAQSAQSEYRAAVDQVGAIHDLAAGEDVYALSVEDMEWLEDEFILLRERILRLKELGGLPLGMDSALYGLPWVSPRYGAANETLDIALMLAEAGITISNIGAESLDALEAQGIRYSVDQQGETWLEVIRRRESELVVAVEKIEEAAIARGEIAENYLPESIKFRLMQIDALLDRFSGQLALIEELPHAYEVLGIDEPRRYLGLFQNPAELRQPGGFAGTILIVDVHRGQMTHYEFRDVFELSRDFQTKQDRPEPSPWAVHRYIRQDGLQVQDANWWADFPTSARQIMKMYEVAEWPEIQGVVALQPELISDLMAVTGPVTVEVDGELREITPENLHDESERQRRLDREGMQRETGHKEVIALIGETLIDHISEGDRHDLIDAVFLLFDGLDRRDMQGYFIDDGVQGFVEGRNWAGLLVPYPETPTISATFANITGLKTSLAMQPAMHLEIVDESARDVEAELTISLENRGDAAGDPFYEGFQRWWLEVMLPEGSSVIDTDPRTAPDPDALNGGGYVVNLDTGERKEITIRFAMPQADELLIRRQPGLVTMQSSVYHPDCQSPLEFWVEQDVLMLLGAGCPEIVYDEEELDEW